MSTEVFRKYLDILNEHTDAEIQQLSTALSNLETVLGKYKDKIHESVFEDDIPDPPFSSGDSAPRTPKPRVKKGPDGKWLQQSPSGEWVPVEPTPAPTNTEPTTADARARYRQTSSPVEPEPGRISKAASKVWDVAKTGAAKAADLAKLIPKGGLGKIIAGLGVAGTLAAIDMYGNDVREWIADWLQSTDFSKLPPADQEIIKTNWAIVEPYAAANVIKTVPTDLQTRIGNVINLLTKLGMVIQGHEQKSFLDRAKGLGDYLPSVSWNKTPAPPAADDPSKPEKQTLDQILQKADQRVKGVQESELSDVERMARLRDILNDDITLIDPIKDKLSAMLSTVLGVPAALAASPVVIDMTSVAWLQYSRMREAAGGGPATLAGFAKWLLKIPKWRKWLFSIAAGAVAVGVQVYGIKAAVDKVSDTVDSWGNETKDIEAAVDAYDKMTDEEYAALSKDDKLKLDRILLYHCWNFPQKPGCMDMQKDMVKRHPDWALVQKIMKIHPEWPEVKQACQANPNLPGCQV